jgi:hypothetical protein
MPLITTDIKRFLSVIESGDFGDGLEARLQSGYLDDGTPGLAEYSRRFGLTAESLAKAVRKQPAYYRSLHDIEARIEVQIPAINDAVSRMRELYPATDPGTVYFVVGALRAGGQNSSVGALISVDMFAADGELAAEDRPPGRLFPSSQLPIIIAHELTHRQQVIAQGIETYLEIYGERQSVLANAIREGTAEFLALKTAGSTTDPASFAFGLENEAAIWHAFEKDRASREYGDWFYVKPKANPDWPPDLGYFVGARIAESFYRNATDKKQALAEILAVTDFDRFLVASGYAESIAREDSISQ